MTQTAPGTAPAPVPLERVTHWIDGKPFAGVTERTAPVYDPALGAVRTEVPLASVDEVDQAVASGRRRVRLLADLVADQAHPGAVR
ncbi:hypothetical protein QTS76_02775, partial [Micromonospora sp. b486]|nr:hypothetical protein [Micromonospora sp. b486]